MTEILSEKIKSGKVDFSKFKPVDSADIESEILSFIYENCHL